MKMIAELSILVVEDHPVQKKLFIEQLHQLGCCSIVSANDGVEAMAVMSRQPVDVVFCDINMPNMGGSQFAVAQGALARRAGQALPMLIWMSSEDPNVLNLHVMLARDAGFLRVQAYAKPLTPGAIVQILANALAIGNGIAV